MKPKKSAPKKAQSGKAKKASQTNAQTGFALPQPMELAKLAAILAPNAQPDAALKKAMEFYIEAGFFLRELPSNFEDLVKEYGSHKRNIARMAQPLRQLIEAQWADTLELDPAKVDDAARQFLAGRGLGLKDARSVLKHFRRYLKTIPRSPGAMSDGSVFARCVREKNGKTTYMIPRFILDDIVKAARACRSKSRRKGAKTRQGKPPVN